jgi:hypothetical protein
MQRPRHVHLGLPVREILYRHGISQPLGYCAYVARGNPYHPVWGVGKADWWDRVHDWLPPTVLNMKMLASKARINAITKYFI